MMRLALLLVLCTAMAAYAFEILNPPQQYQLPYIGEVMVIEMPFHEIDAVCRTDDTYRNYPGKTKIGACTRVRRDSCTIIIPLADIDRVTPKMREAFERHELAHCNGWHHLNE
jgi:cytochrome c biogenesis protein CcdA